jgi:hypothetical protein
MPYDTWLRVIAVGALLAGALVIWRWGGRFPRAQRWVAAGVFGAAGLAATLLFLLNRHYACILSAGRGSCLTDGLGTLAVCTLNAFLAARCVLPETGSRGRSVILSLLLSGALAGMGTAQNLLVLIVFLNLFMFVVYRWPTGKGIQPRFLVLRDDYKDDESR